MIDVLYCGYCGRKMTNGSRYNYWEIKVRVNGDLERLVCISVRICGQELCIREEVFTGQTG
ncbi:MAG: hypothetical protein ACLVB1_01845 [Blautia obeum]